MREFLLVSSDTLPTGESIQALILRSHVVRNGVSKDAPEGTGTSFETPLRGSSG
jgi:hypothetical protein